MILPDRFTPRELHKEVVADSFEMDERFLNFAKRNIKKIHRYVKNLSPTTVFPLDGPIKHYKSKNNNHWYAYYTIADKVSFLKNTGFGFTKFCIVDTAKGKYVYLPTSNAVKLTDFGLKPDETIHVRIYTPHYFRRYKEREILDSDSPITNSIDLTELVRHHLYYNASGIDSKHCDELRREFNDSEIVEVMNSGFGLGKNIDINVSIMETYISWDMALPEQKELFQRLREKKYQYDLKENNLPFMPKESLNF